MTQQRKSRDQEPVTMRELSPAERDRVGGGTDPRLKELLRTTLKNAKLDAQLGGLYRRLQT